LFSRVASAEREAAAPTAAIAFVDIDKVGLRYGETAETQALVDLRMQVGKGEFAAVVGPSGCGKSSLMKLVTGLLPPTAGTVKVADNTVRGPLEIVEPHRERLRRQRADYEKIACGLLETVGLGGLEKHQPWMLSGGMQQRANLCRSLVHSPELLMLDEPFGALDAFTREELWGVLQELWLQRRFTCILVTHDLREAAYLADVIFVMSARPGRVIGTHRVDLPRPRTVETTFDPAFVDLVHKIRSQIAEARGGKALGRNAEL
jgi:NitT/TauT family transport system ATP-binding protein